MRSTFHYPESPYERTYADVITKIYWMDSLPNYFSYGAPLAKELRYYYVLSHIVHFVMFGFGKSCLSLITFSRKENKISADLN